MSKTRILGSEIFQYPETGDINYGEEASGWVGEATNILSGISGPGDIPTTQQTLLTPSGGTYTTGTIDKLVFNTAFVQSLEVSGFITRTYSDSTPKQVEYFKITGAYNGTVINYSVEYSGNETELEFTISGGQFGYSYLNLHPDQVTAGPTVTTSAVTIKFEASATVDESFFA